jgi:hypothetical protein
MKTKRKSLAILLVFIMLVSLLPTSSLYASEENEHTSVVSDFSPMYLEEPEPGTEPDDPEEATEPESDQEETDPEEQDEIDESAIENTAIDYIIYSFNDISATASVVDYEAGNPSTDIVIPKTIENEGKTYTVTTIGNSILVRLE